MDSLKVYFHFVPTKCDRMGGIFEKRVAVCCLSCVWKKLNDEKKRKKADASNNINAFRVGYL